MSFGNWFQHNGAKIFAFATAAGFVLQAFPWMPVGIDHTVEAIGALATVAHHIFFPNAQGPSTPKVE